MAETFGTITAYHDSIDERYNPQQFFGRRWLIDEVTHFRDDKDRRCLVIVGGPGSGKSTFLAYLAELWNCPRHFIRMDNIGGVTGISSHAFLIALGSQLYEKYGPTIFEHGLAGNTHVTVGRIKDQAEVVGRFVEFLYKLPFLPPQQDDVDVNVNIATGNSKVVGERIKSQVDVTLGLDDLTLLHATLIDPLHKIQELYPTEKVLILVDALDEAAQHTETSILDILPRSADAAFPPNLHLLMTSRNGNHLSIFHAAELLDLEDKKKGYWQANQQDVRGYIAKQLAEAPFADMIATWKREDFNDYIAQIVEHSQNNFLYLYYFFRELSTNTGNGQVDLRSFEIPRGLSEIYRSFAVEKIRKNVEDVIQFMVLGQVPPSLQLDLKAHSELSQVEVSEQKVIMTTSNSDLVMYSLSGWLGKIGVQTTIPRLQKAEQLGVWEEKYLPILGSMAVAYGPLYCEQIAGFAHVEITYVASVLAQLKQFLSEVADEQDTAYQFYHPSFSEYLLDKQQNRDYPLDGLTYHFQIAAYYRGDAATWTDVQWKDNYSLLYLASHLFQLRNDRTIDQERHGLYGLICRSYMKAKYIHFGSHRPFSNDLALAIRAAEGEKLPNWVQMVRTSLVMATLESLMANVPPPTVAALAEMGMLDKAENFAALIAHPERQCQAYTWLAEILLTQKELKRAQAALKQALAAIERFGDKEARIDMLSIIALDLMHAGERELAGDVIAQIAVLTQAIGYTFRNETLAGRLIKVLIELGEQDLAQSVVTGIAAAAAAHNIKVVREVALSKVVPLLVQIGELQQAEHVADEISERVPLLWQRENTQLTTNTPIQTSAQAAADAYTSGGYSSYGFTNIASAQARSQKSISENETALISISISLAQSGYFNQAMAVIMAFPDDRDKLNYLSVVVLQMLWAGEQEWAVEIVNLLLAKIEEIWGEQRDPGQEPSGYESRQAEILSWTALALLRAGEHDRAIALRERALATVETITYKFGANLALSSIANDLIEAKEFDQAVEVAQKIDDAYWKASTLCSVAQALGLAKKLPEAATVASQAFTELKAFTIDKGKQDFLLDKIAKVLAWAKEFTQTLEVAHAISDEHARAYTLSEVARIWITLGEHAQAEEVVNQILVEAEMIRYEDWKAITLNSIAQQLVQAGELGHAAIVAKQALEALQTIWNEQVRLNTLVMTVYTLTQAGEVEQAMTLSETISDMYRKALAFSTLARQLARQKQSLPLISELAAKARGAAEAYMYVDPDAWQKHSWPLAQVREQAPRTDKWDKAFALSEIALQLALAGEYTQALAVIKLVETIKEERDQSDIHTALFQTLPLAINDQSLIAMEIYGDHYWGAFALSEVALSFYQAGQVGQALREAVTIAYKRKKVGALCKIALVLKEAGAQTDAESMVAQAIVEAESIWEKKYRVIVLSDLAQFLLQAEKQESAYEMMQKAVALLKEIGDDGNHIRVLGTVILVLIQLGEKEDADSLVDRELTTARAIKDTSSRARALNEVAATLAQLGNVKQAMIVAREIEDYQNSNGAIGNIAMVCVRAGEHALAFNTAHSIEYPPLKVIVLSDMAQALQSMGQQEQALAALHEALTIARITGRGIVIDLVQRGITTLSDIDQGKTLWRIYEVLQEIDGWWSN
jgi:hypothetical protein